MSINEAMFNERRAEAALANSHLLEVAQAAFVELRKAWFHRVLESHAHEREWESEDQKQWRKESNQKLLSKYNEQTARILRGEKLCIDPRCGHDMDSISGAAR